MLYDSINIMYELLAPSGDLQSFYTAINCGADAVYLGLSNFNARMKADNFTNQNLKEAVAFAHLYGVKVYVTINTLLHDSEFNQLISLVKMAVCAKVDAFIVQYLGAVKVLKNCFPNINLHASTQMGVHNLYGAKILEKMGFSRVVLSRETKLEDIKLIKKHTNLEIEFFVQGALCIAFSGNCYLSSVEQNASGNRGLCKQLCRLPYTANTCGKVENGFLMSAKDLCLINNLKELIDAGVTSFKIEGRLRRSGYVAVAVLEYREALDGILANRKQKVSDKNLRKVFNRGEFLSRAYLDQEPPFVVEKRFNNHIGIEAGKVLSVRPFKDLFKIEIYSKYPIKKGDGLKFFDGNKEVTSLGVGNVQNIADNRYLVFSKRAVKVNYKCNIILDFELEQEAQSKINKIEIGLKVFANAGAPLLLSATSGEVSVSVASDFLLEVANNSPLDKQELKKQVSKTADTGFVVSSVMVETDGVFCPKSKINALRRELFQKLKSEIRNQNEKDIKAYTNEKAIDYYLNEKTLNQNNSIVDIEFKSESNLEIIKSKTQNILNSEKITLKYFYENEIKGFKDSCNQASHKVDNLKAEDSKTVTVIAPNNFSKSSIEKMLDCKQTSKKALLLPNIANSRDIEKIEKLLDYFKNQFEYLIIQNLWGFAYADDFKLICSEQMNCINAYSKTMLKKFGAECVVVSFEANQTIKAQSDCVQVNFKRPLMTFCHCPYKTIFANDCSQCKNKFDLHFERNRNHYIIERVKIENCYFVLYAE